jgi:hypothetical protein
VSPEAPDRGCRLKQRSQKFRTPPPGMFFSFYLYIITIIYNLTQFFL